LGDAVRHPQLERVIRPMVVLFVFGSSDLPTVRRALGEQRVTPRWTYVGGKQSIEFGNEARTLEDEEAGRKLPSS
jgi:hypothetical protein